MLVPSDMIGAQTKLMNQLEKFQAHQVSDRNLGIRKTILDVCTVVQDMLKEVEAQEPRFISSLTELNGRYDGLRVLSPTEFEVVLYLNQMGEFNFIVAQACDKSTYRDSVKMMNDASEVKIRIREKYVVQITPAFKCNGMEGFDLLSKESTTLQNKQSSSSMEGDAWIISFQEAENQLLIGASRKKCLSILKTIRDRHLDIQGNPVTSHVIQTLILYECEKHPGEERWEDHCLGDRITGIILQLISCLQCRKCPHYFLPSVDLFRGKSSSALDTAAKLSWRLMRELLTNSKALETL